MHGIDTIPKTIEQTLVMCDKCRQRGHKVNMPVKTKDPGVVCIQQGVTEPLLGRGGKPLKCFHCGENHKISDCPDIDDAKKKEIMDKRRKHWEERIRRPYLDKPTSKLRLMRICKVTTKMRMTTLTLPSCRMKLKTVPC